jgi:hypothetical protein
MPCHTCKVARGDRGRCVRVRLGVDCPRLEVVGNDLVDLVLRGYRGDDSGPRDKDAVLPVKTHSVAT